MINKENFTIAVEESIMIKGMPATASSKMLENFVSPFDATIISKLKAAGISITHRTNGDELGIDNVMDSPETPDIIPEAIDMVINGTCRTVLCNDFSGKMRRMASLSGLYYIHPTYGTVSRFGLIASVSSMDQIGILCKDPEDGRYILSIIAGHDASDGTSYYEESYDYNYEPSEATAKIKVGIPTNVLAWIDEPCRNAVLSFAQDNNFEICEFELKYFEALAPVQYILSCAEISNNTNRFDGIKYGYRTTNYSNLNDLYLNSRTEAFGLNAKLAAIMGSMVLSQNHYEPTYNKAMQVRRLLAESLDYSKYDLILLPASATPLYADRNPYEESALYALPTLCGLPSIAVPVADGLGVTLTASVKNEALLFHSAKSIFEKGR